MIDARIPRAIDGERTRRPFSQRLEERAREVAAGVNRADWDASVVSALDREIALTLDQLDRLRALHVRLARDLLRTECSIGTQIMQLSPWAPHYREYLIDPREKMQNKMRHDHLRDKMRAVDEERRRLAVSREERIQSLENRLLTLLERHTQLAYVPRGNAS